MTAICLRTNAGLLPNFAAISLAGFSKPKQMLNSHCSLKINLLWRWHYQFRCRFAAKTPCPWLFRLGWLTGNSPHLCFKLFLCAAAAFFFCRVIRSQSGNAALGILETCSGQKNNGRLSLTPENIVVHNKNNRGHSLSTTLCCDCFDMCYTATAMHSKCAAHKTFCYFELCSIC